MGIFLKAPQDFEAAAAAVPGKRTAYTGAGYQEEEEEEEVPGSRDVTGSATGSVPFSVQQVEYGQSLQPVQ